MNPQFSVITLGVDDLDRALAFYHDGLGLATKGIVGTEYPGDDTHPAGRVVMFNFENGLTFALYPRTELAKDAGIPVAPGAASEFSIGHFVKSKEEVDALIELARSAGATVAAKPYTHPWGIYSGYFQDPDGHLWEILFNPEG